jgi:uncharacterized protein YbbC (DUF1343 family)
MDGLQDVRYSVIKVEGLRRKDSMRTMLRSGYASSFPFASPNMPSWNSSLFFPAFVVLEATNVRCRPLTRTSSFVRSLSLSQCTVRLMVFSLM